MWGLALARRLKVGALAGLTVAFSHFMFNILGIVIIYPIRFIRQIPIGLAQGLGRLVLKNRFYALGYIGVVFFIIPIIIIFATRGMGGFYEPPAPAGIESTVLPDTSGQETAVPIVPPDSLR